MLHCLLLGQYRICGIIYCQSLGAMPVLGALPAAWYSACCLVGCQLHGAVARCWCQIARRLRLHRGAQPGAAWMVQNVGAQW